MEDRFLKKICGEGGKGVKGIFSSASRAVWYAIFLVSFPFGILSFVLPIYGKQLGASALEIGGFISAVSLVPIIVWPFLGRSPSPGRHRR